MNKSQTNSNVSNVAVKLTEDVNLAWDPISYMLFSQQKPIKESKKNQENKFLSVWEFLFSSKRTYSQRTNG